MTLAVTAATTGALVPPRVQVVVSGLVTGDSYRVSGRWSGGSWAVRGGAGQASTSQVVLTDVAAPVNTPITYRVESDSDTADSASLTVPWSDDYENAYLLQSLDGEVTVAFQGIDTGDEREYGMRSTTFAIPGRRSPVVVYDVPGSESGSWEIITDGSQTERMRDLVGKGGPVLLRTDGSVRDMPASQYAVMTGVASRWLGGSSSRVWSLAYQVIDDPQPDTILPTSTWDDFAAVYTGTTWDDFATHWTGSTWNEFERVDWTTY